MMFLEYDRADDCVSTEAMYLCLHCGKCGRKFVDGVLTNYDEHPSTEPEDDPNVETVYLPFEY